MADAELPNVSDMSAQTDEVTLKDVDAFFGIEEKEEVAKPPKPPSHATRSMIELPMLTQAPERVGRKSEERESTGGMKLSKDYSMRVRRVVNAPGMARILNPRTGRRG
jgi:hypothetical protein